MDKLGAFSIKIAEEAVPDEVELAPIMTQAYLTGGREREELFQQPGSGLPGGFGAENIGTVFPWVLNGIGLAAPAILSLVSSGPLLKDLLSVVKDLISVHDTLKRREKKDKLPEKPYAPLKQTMDIISTELQNTQLPPDERDLIAYRILRRLLEEPTNAAEFVQAVGGAG